MARWGICTTVKAPPDQALAFVAHHLLLGPEMIWLHLDDPDSTDAMAIARALTGIDRVTVVPCNDAYWASTCKRRPAQHQNRQSRNMQRVYTETSLPWVAHLDVDEYLVADRPISDLLAAHPADRPMLRVAPWEALFTPGLPDDIFSACHFRAVIPAEARQRVFGRYAALLPKGALSHAAGKCFFRIGIDGFEPRLHGAFKDGNRLPSGDFSRELALFHFHAEDPARWQERLQFRLSKGAYKFNPALQAHLLAADDREIGAFFRKVQTATPKILETLQELGAIRHATLNLRAKVARLTGEPPP
jgi:hypothetical protein